MAERLLHDFAQKLLTTAATGLLAHGVLMQSDTAQFVEVGVALVMYAGGCIWTVAAAKIRQIRERELASK